MLSYCLKCKKKKDLACFQHDMAYEDFKDLSTGTASDKVLCDKAINIAKNPKYDGYQRGLASMVYEFFDKKSASVSGVKNKIEQNQRPLDLATQAIADELHKPIIRNFGKRKVYSSFKDNILDADLADIQLINKYNKGIRFLLCVIDIYSKYAWVIPLKDKKSITITNGF